MDITYTKDEMFTRFMPETYAGEAMWREMYDKHSAAAVFNFEAKRVIAEMRAAGYSVGKAKPVKLSMSDEELLAELGV